jgi:F-type H+-transporting ATPase subunit a
VVPDEKLGVFGLFEVMAETVLSFMAGLMDQKRAHYFFPLIAAFAFFILACNLLGMIPGMLPPTAVLNTTIGLGLIVFFVTHYYGVKTHGLAYFKEFFGPIQKWYALPLMILMFFIELISHLVRPVSLGVRLMGNMMGDHKVTAIFLGFGVLFVPLPMMFLGLLVAFVQTLVFCLLSVVYIALATEESHGHESPKEE